MDLLYNPDQMAEEDIKATFVARQSLVNEIITTIEHQPDGAGVQHLVIIAPRGMGKTTVMLMVKFSIEEGELADKWKAVKFTEESPSIYDLADFWLEVLKLLVADTKDRDLERRIKEIETKYRKNEDLQEAALALIKDWRREQDKRLVLLVENLDMIFQQINNERDNARLRSILMNEGTMMLIGGATSIFKEAREYDQALYNFFKIENLADLQFEQMKELLLKRAEIDKVENFAQKIEQNKGRLRALEYFTGGNPRLVLMLYRVVKNSALKEIRRELEKLLDEVTPFFKHKTDPLPAQQKKILDHIARISGITREGVTPGEIAEAVRLAPNQVSSQLKRLAEMGYVHAANIRRRASYYVLSEPLYAIWYQMRFGREQRERMGWLITFLKVFFTREEMLKQSSDLESLFRKRLKEGQQADARDTLELYDYLSEAMEEAPMRTSAKESVIRGYIEMNEAETVKKELLASVNLEDLSEEALKKLVESGCINQEQSIRAIIRKNSKTATEEERNLAEEIGLATQAYFSNKFDEALKHVNIALKIRPNNDKTWNRQGAALENLGRPEEALTSFNRALEINPDNDKTWYNRGIVLGNLGRPEEALASFNRALEINPDKDNAWYNCGVALGDLGRPEEALVSYDRALKLNPDKDEAWSNRGTILENLGRPEEALASFNRALEINPDNDKTWYNCGVALGDLGRPEEALVSYDRALKLNPDKDEVWYNRGIILGNLGRPEEALASYDRALEINPNDDEAWSNRGTTFGDLGRHEEALANYDRALEINPDNDKTWYNRGITLGDLGRHEEALVSYDRALKLNPNKDEAWNNHGNTLGDLGRHEEALASYDRALEINPNDDEAWSNRGITLGNLGRHEEALASYDRALELSPSKDNAWNSRGVALGNLGRYEEALVSFSRALELNPDKDNAWYNRGITLEDLGRHEKALASYDRALEINSNDDRTCYNRGITLENLGRPEEALASYDRALELNPDKDNAWYNRGVVLENLGRPEEALASYDRALELNPDKDNAWYNRGVAYLARFIDCIQHGNFDAAKSEWRKAYESWEKTNNSSWQSVVLEVLLIFAQGGNLNFVRELITDANLEEVLFPLARAIDYLQAKEDTEKEELIEKLSPEVRGIVEEVITKLQPVAQKSTRRKTKTSGKAKRKKK